MEVIKDLKAVCSVGGDEKTVFIKLDLYNNLEFITTLEFAEITEEFNELVDINLEMTVYLETDELKKDLANAYLSKFLNESRSTDYKLDLLLNLRMKMKHQEGTCKDNCILCSPDLGDDPFPDFMFEARHADHEGEA